MRHGEHLPEANFRGSGTFLNEAIRPLNCAVAEQQIIPDPPRALAPPPPAPMPVQPEDTRVEITLVEITLPDGTCVRVGADVGLASLRRIMAAVRR